MRYLILIIPLLLSGCAQAVIHRDSTGRVFKVDTRGQIEVKESAEETYINSKPELFKDIINLNGLKTR